MSFTPKFAKVLNRQIRISQLGSEVESSGKASRDLKNTGISAFVYFRQFYTVQDTMTNTFHRCFPRARNLAFQLPQMVLSVDHFSPLPR